MFRPDHAASTATKAIASLSRPSKGASRSEAPYGDHVHVQVYRRQRRRTGDRSPCDVEDKQDQVADAT